MGDRFAPEYATVVIAENPLLLINHNRLFNSSNEFFEENP